MAAVGGDPRLVGVPVALGAVAGDRGADGGAGLTVVHEDVGLPVGVVGNEIRRPRGEGDVAAVGGDRGADAAAVRLGAVAGHGDADGRALLEVPDEDVLVPVRVVGDQVVGPGLESRVAAVAGDGAVPGLPVGLGSLRGDRDPGDGPRLQVEDEGVPQRVRVVGHQVGGRRVEGDVPTRCRERRELAAAGRLGRGGERDADGDDLGPDQPRAEQGGERRPEDDLPEQPVGASDHGGLMGPVGPGVGEDPGVSRERAESRSGRGGSSGREARERRVPWSVLGRDGRDRQQIRPPKRATWHPRTGRGSALGAETGPLPLYAALLRNSRRRAPLLQRAGHVSASAVQSVP